MLLASALTSWQVRVKQIARTRNWHALEAALSEQRPVRAGVVGKAPKGVRIRVYGLNGLLPFGGIRGVKRTTPPNVVEAKVQGMLGEQLEVDVLQLAADRGTLIVGCSRDTRKTRP
jgi:ribosomal protein S1